MNGRTAKQLRRGLFDEMVASGTLENSGYRIAVVRRKGGEQAQVLVCTGFRHLYREMKRDLKALRRRSAVGIPPSRAGDEARARKRAARARSRAEWRRRAAEIRAAKEGQA